MIRMKEDGLDYDERMDRLHSRILLERIRPVWNRIGFLGKVTARNIFRFKSRLITNIRSICCSTPWKG